MAKQKKTPLLTPTQPLVAWVYTGPAYPRVKIDGVPTFVPNTISQQRIGELMARHPDELAAYFERARRVKPGIDTAAGD